MKHQYNKERYKKFCEERSDIPLFMQAWWMDAVCTPENKVWDVLFCEENGKILGVMPYHLLEKWGFKVIVQPQLTQYNGFWIDYPPDCKLYKRYSFEKKVMDNLIAQLDSLKIDFYSQNFHYSFTNWQPFYWKGFKQMTRYTYILKNIDDIDVVFNNFHPRYKQRIRKSVNEYSVDFNLSPNEFYQFHKNSLQEKKEKISYSEQLFNSIYEEATERKQGKIIAVRDKKENLLSAMFFIWDTHSGYKLITARKIDEHSNNVSVFMDWETLKFLQDKTQNYDFEGSIIEGVALFNQYLSAKQMPYFNIEKSYSKVFSLLKKIRNGNS
ncbi:MAG: hypothetical protein LBS07_03350 [Prevotellaceae bacterium]|jgi:hypothetical protein|nr:hypothetical protein [Prevotellaceae bacterium]